MNYTEKLSKLRKYHLNTFKTGSVEYQSFNDYLWQIFINKSFDWITDRKCFHTDGDRIVLTVETGGFYPSQVFFSSNDYSIQCMVCNELNNELFGLIESESDLIVGRSMSANLD